MEPSLNFAHPSASRKWLRRAAWCVLWCATVLVLAVSSLSAYARHRYQSSLARGNAAGLPSSWEEVLPKPVPDADNFGAVEDFKPFLAVEEAPPAPDNPWGGKVTYLDEKGMRALKEIKPLKISGGTQKALGFFEARSLAELRQKALEERRIGPDSGALSDAEAVLKVFEDLDPLWRRLHEAKQRPHAVLYVPLKKPSFTTVNQIIGPSLALAQVAQLKARALLYEKRGEAAFEECLLLLKIADLRSFPTLIEHLVRVTKIGTLMPVLHEGVSRHVWTDAQLAAIEKRLAGVDLVGELRRSFEAETLFSRGLNEAVQSGNVSSQAFAAMFSPAFESRSQLSVEKILPTVFPKTLSNILCSGALDGTIQMVNVLSEKDGPRLRGRTGPPDLHWGPLNRIAGLTGSAFEGLLKTTARGQSLVNIARVAIALERHRLRNGNYPTTLEELAPNYLSSIPKEVFDGAPLHYFLRNDAQSFTLYSTGWKGTDDGGVADNNKPDQGNWAWTSP